MKVVKDTYIDPSKEASNSAFRKAVEASGIGVWDWDSLTGKVTYSPESLNIIGYKPEEISPKHDEWDKRVHPDDREAYYKNFNLHLNNLLPYYINEHRIKCKDGSYKWILDKGRIVKRTLDGKPLRIIGTHTDISSLKENENLLKETVTTAEKQNTKLKNFTHIVSHNLKSHIGNLQCIVNYYEEADNASERKELFQHIKTISESLTNTIGHLNELVSIESSKEKVTKKLNVNAFINDTIKVIENEIHKTKAVILNEIDENLNISFNPAYLESIILNLLSNALKYRHPDRNPVIGVKNKIENGRIKFLISDNGIGIDLEKYGDDVFQLYRTFHNNPNAEGVGLYLVRSQIEALGGTIAIESEVNVGTTFIISFDTIN